MSQDKVNRTSLEKKSTEDPEVANVEPTVELALQSTRNALGEESAQVTDHAAEVRLTWKFDTHLLVGFHLPSIYSITDCRLVKAHPCSHVPMQCVGQRKFRQRKNRSF